MRKAADFLVEKRTIILIVVAVLVAASLFLLPKVKIISDMREYLPDDSRIHKGLQILEKAFPKTADAGGEIRVMFKGLDAKEKASMAKKLSGMPHVSQVHYEAGSRDYEKGAYTLYTVDADCAPGTSQIESLTKKLEAQFGEDEGYRMVYKITDDTTGSLKLWIIVAAIAMIMGILFLMCSSWVEPLLILCTIGMAVLLNMGTNAFLPSVSQTTHSIAAILQMVLSGNSGARLKDIIAKCGGEGFPRIKIGVGQKPHPDYDMAQWVLSTFKDQDAEQIRSAVQRAAQAVDAVITQGMDKAMNEYNHG